MTRRVSTFLAGMMATALLAASGPAAGQDCVSCSLDSTSCNPDPLNDACRCVIKSHGGFFVCFERDFFCDANLSCNPDPPPTSPTFVIQATALRQLDIQEPLLSLVLYGVMYVNDSKETVLNLEPWVRGTLNGKAGRYVHRGVFSSRGNGQVAFHFVLKKDDGSTITFAGIIRDRARSITYSKVTRTGSTARSEKFDWKAAE